MSLTPTSGSSIVRWVRLLILSLAAAAAPLGGCTETDSFLFDPSVVGRWEHTPTRVPILTQLQSVEGSDSEFVEYSDITPADLVPEVAEYRIGPGDRLIITLADIPDEGRYSEYDRIVDTRGFVELPVLGQVYINNMTSREAAEAVKTAMRELIADPLAFVVVVGPRMQHFSIFGGVVQPGQYQIPTADYRLLEALTASRGFAESPPYIYIIRQVPLTEEAAGRPTPPAPRDGAQQPPMPGVRGERLIDIIDRLGGPTGATGATGPTGAPAPTAPTAPTGAPAPTGRPAIDLIGPDRAQPAAAPTAPPDATDGTWVNIQGRWVKVRPAGAPAGPRSAVQPPQMAMTQRIIRVPTARVAMGDARYNVVIRPGDVIRVPPSPSGMIYLSGQVARPGAYGNTEGLTLTRVIASAGGLNGIAVPERVDIVRMTGPEQQGFVRVNLRAIEEGTHPDIFLKGNDRVNVGTNFWATPLAVIRNGFRASYGFGFVADRNFGNDIFGAPPDSLSR
ncbi:MAG: polysaccharide biosynthesis/export family protein [Phycisphaerales bacterium]